MDAKFTSNGHYLILVSKTHRPLDDFEENNNCSTSLTIENCNSSPLFSG